MRLWWEFYGSLDDLNNFVNGVDFGIPRWNTALNFQRHLISKDGDEK